MSMNKKIECESCGATSAVEELVIAGEVHIVCINWRKCIFNPSSNTNKEESK